MAVICTWCFESRWFRKSLPKPPNIGAGIGRGGDFPLASCDGKVRRPATSRGDFPRPSADFVRDFRAGGAGSGKEVAFSSTSRRRCWTSATAFTDGLTHSITLHFDSSFSDQSTEGKVCICTADRGVLSVTLHFGRLRRLTFTVNELSVDQPVRIIALGRARRCVVACWNAEKRDVLISSSWVRASDPPATRQARQHGSVEPSTINLIDGHFSLHDPLSIHFLIDPGRFPAQFPARFPPGGRFPRWLPGQLPGTSGYF